LSFRSVANGNRYALPGFVEKRLDVSFAKLAGKNFIDVERGEKIEPSHPGSYRIQPLDSRIVVEWVHVWKDRVNDIINYMLTIFISQDS